MTLAEIIKERYAFEKALEERTKEYNDYREQTLKLIAALKNKELAVEHGFDLEKIETGKLLVYIKGDPYAHNDDIHSYDKTIAELAIKDLLSGCTHLSKEYYGNKTYDGFYQRSDHPYGMGPTYGSIKDAVGLRFPNHIPNEKEVEAAVYYIRTYNSIKKINQVEDQL